jgi:hypothetical protein
MTKGKRHAVMRHETMGRTLVQTINRRPSGNLRT